MHLQNDHGCMGHVATDVCFVYTRPPWKSIVMFFVLYSIYKFAMACNCYMYSITLVSDLESYI